MCRSGGTWGATRGSVPSPFSHISLLSASSLFPRLIPPFPYPLCELEDLGSAVSSPSGSAQCPASNWISSLNPHTFRRIKLRQIQNITECLKQSPVSCTKVSPWNYIPPCNDSIRPDNFWTSKSHPARNKSFPPSRSEVSAVQKYPPLRLTKRSVSL